MATQLKDPTMRELRDAILGLAEGLGDLTNEIDGFAQEANLKWGPMGSINRPSAAAQSMQVRLQNITNAMRVA